MEARPAQAKGGSDAQNIRLEYIDYLPAWPSSTWPSTHYPKFARARSARARSPFRRLVAGFDFAPVQAGVLGDLCDGLEEVSRIRGPALPDPVEYLVQLVVSLAGL